MRREGVWRLNGDVQPVPFCSPAIILAALLILPVSGRYSDIGVAAEEETAAKLDQTSLRYLPDDCHILARMDPQALLDCEEAGQLAAFVRGTALFPPLDLTIEEVEQITVGASRFGDAETSQIVFILHCNQPSKVLRGTEPGSAKSERVANHTVWVKPGPATSTSATCIVEDRIVLMGGPSAVRNVLLRNDPAELPERLKRAYGQLDDEAGAALAILTKDDILQNGAFGLPASLDLSQRIDALTAEIELNPKVTLQLAAFCCDEAAAQQLYGMGVGMRAFLEGQNVRHQDFRVGQILQSLESKVDGTVLKASMDLPFGFVQVQTGGTANGVWSTTSLPSGTPPAPSVCAAPSGFSPPVTCPPGWTSGYSSGVSRLPPGHSAHDSSWTAPPHVAANSSTSVWDPYATPGVPRAAIPSSPSQLPVIQISGVIRMSEAGVDEEVIVRHIRKRQLETALTDADLILLTENEVPTPVIIALQDLPCVRKAVGSTATPPAPNDGAATVPPAR